METHMTGNDYQHLKIGELRALLKELDEVAQSTYSPETKARRLRNIDRRVHDLIALLLSPALAAICDTRNDNGNPAGHREATEMDFIGHDYN
jgi:hypothetical protein